MNDMKKIQECLGPELDEMNAIIVETLRTSNQMMDDIVTRYLKIKGKQIRPILVILSARMFGSVSREVLSALSALGKELSLGEIDQICNARDHALDESSYFGMIRQKTASLFMNCVRMGAELGGATQEGLEKLVRYAELLGLCFQIKDDIFDYYEDTRIGKPTGNDLREGKVTLPLLYALRTAPEPEARPMRDLLLEGTLSGDDINRLIEFAKAHGGIDYAYSRMRDMQREGEKILSTLPDTESRKAFGNIFDFIISRDN